MTPTFASRVLGAMAAFALLFVACSGDSSDSSATANPDPTAAADPTAEADPTTTGALEDGVASLTVYSGRSEELIGPLIERFEAASGFEVAVRYADTAQLAATLLEEGARSPADVYIAQDAGALGAVAAAGLLAPLDAAILERVSPTFRSAQGEWVGLSGRVRTVVYNTERVDPSELPASILEFTDSQWSGRAGWASLNGSFQAFVTALRLTEGDEGARDWLEAMRANEVVDYANNTAIVAAVAAGEIDVGFVNHYYVHRFLAEKGDAFAARNYYTAPGDAGTLVNVAGAGVLTSSDAPEVAEALIEFLLSDEAQRYFAEETFEYPLVAGVPASADLASIEDLRPVELDLSRLEDLEATLALMRDAGVLP